MSKLYGPSGSDGLYSGETKPVKREKTAFADAAWRDVIAITEPLWRVRAAAYFLDEPGDKGRVEAYCKIIEDAAAEIVNILSKEPVK